MTKLYQTRVCNITCHEISFILAMLLMIVATKSQTANSMHCYNEVTEQEHHVSITVFNFQYQGSEQSICELVCFEILISSCSSFSSSIEYIADIVILARFQIEQFLQAPLAYKRVHSFAVSTASASFVFQCFAIFSESGSSGLGALRRA